MDQEVGGSSPPNCTSKIRDLGYLIKSTGLPGYRRATICANTGRSNSPMAVVLHAIA